MSDLPDQARARLADDPRAALDLADRAVAEAPGPRERALSLQIRTRALRALGRHDDALTDFAAAAQAAHEAGDDRLAAQLQVGAIDSLGMLGRYDEAVTFGQTLAQSLDSFGAVPDLVRALGNLGSLHLRLDRYDDALGVYSDALTRLAVEPEPALEGGLRVNRAIALTYLGRGDEALEEYVRVRELYAASDLPFDRAILAANVGFLHSEAGRYPAALAELSAATALFVAGGNEHEAARCDIDLGDTYRALNLLPEADACYDRALALFVRLPLDDDRARAERGKAAVALREERWDEAAAALERAGTLFEARRNTVSVAHVNLLRAELLRRQGNGLAAEVARQARDAFTAAGLDGWAAEASLVGAVAADVADPAVYVAIAAEARRTTRGWLECQAETALGRLLLRQGDAPGAREAFRRGVAALESARTQIAPEELHIAYLAGKEAVYGELVGALLAGDPAPEAVDEALAVLERSRSRLLLERLLTSMEAAPLADETLRRRLTELRGELHRAYRESFALGEGDEPQRRVWTRTGAELEALEADYTRTLRQAELSGGFPATTLQQDPPDRAALQAALEEDESLLLYAQVGERLAAFVLDRRGLTAFPELASAADVRHAARRFRYHLQKMAAPPAIRAALGESLRVEIDAVLRRLYDLLVRPLLSRLIGNRWVVVPAGPLQELPFTALLDGDVPLLERCEVRYAPSAATWHALTTHPGRSASAADLALIGLPGPGVEQVADEIAALAERHPAARVLCGAAATLAATLDALPRHRRVHLATHARFRHDNPQFSGLQLADGWLLARDLYGQRLDADLVTLSACDTAAARREAGDESLGLAPAFLAAGARRVVASLWPADDAATASLMRDFYDALARGRAAAEALREAQQERRRCAPHPYFWAGFCLIGGR